MTLHRRHAEYQKVGLTLNLIYDIECAHSIEGAEQ
jgi:hypothetical protein